MQAEGVCIFSGAEELKEGLFGQVFLHVFEILPYLYERSIFPAWEIRSLLYGAPPDQLTIPGVLDLAYQPPREIRQRVSLRELKQRHNRVLGSDWEQLSRMWKAYFRVPDRILEQADALSPLDRALAVQYRGSDKQRAGWDTNPISHEDFLVLVQDLLAQRPEITSIFAATDEFTFVEKLRAVTDLPVLNLGEISFHKIDDTDPASRADRAILDCVLISRCRAGLETSSALPSFAKIFNPGLELYRASASKLFVEIPYFPVAHVPPLPATTAAGKAILERTMQGDWSGDWRGWRFRKPFATRARTPLRSAYHAVRERIGA